MRIQHSIPWHTTAKKKIEKQKNYIVSEDVSMVGTHTVWPRTNTAWLLLTGN